MALMPIQQYNNSGNSLVSILQGGSSTLSSILDRQIQAGRDIANTRVAQEQDMMRMRQNETALAQRRGETLEKNLLDAMGRSRSAYESDRNFAANQENAAFQRERATSNDLFSRQQNEARLGLAENADRRAGADLQLRQDDAAREVADAEREQKELDAIVGRPSAETLFAPKDGAAAADSIFGPGGALEKPQQTTPTPDQDRLRLEQIDRARSNKKISEPQSQRLDAEELAIKKRLPAETGTVTERRYADSQVKAAKDEAAKSAELLIADTSAFVPQSVVAARGADKKGKVAPVEKESAKAYDADRFESEVNSALNRSVPDEYVNLVPGLTEAQKAKRRQLWEYAHGQGSGKPKSAVDQIPGL